jgi:hypothetical protein
MGWKYGAIGNILGGGKTLKHLRSPLGISWEHIGNRESTPQKKMPLSPFPTKIQKKKKLDPPECSKASQ